MEPTHDDIIEAKEDCIQLSFERYKVKKCCVIKVRQYRYMPISIVQRLDTLTSMDCVNGGIMSNQCRANIFS